MYETLQNCPSCNHIHFTNHLICKDHTVSEQSFALVQCNNCHLVFTNPRPTPTELPKYYESPTYISHTNRANSLINILYKLVRKYTIHQKIKLINSLSEKHKLLDYGCGTGDFLLAAKKSGWATYGYEPDQKARSLAAAKQVTILQDLDTLEEKMHIITAWHVLEHVSNLKDTIRQLTRKLHDKGILIIAVPNMNSLDAQHYQEHWAAYDVPRHLYHFTQISFTHLMKQLKLTVLKTVPMVFDAYYVSMLSEKHLHGQTNIFSSFKHGWQSNKKAQTTGEHSSLIYILKK